MKRFVEGRVDNSNGIPVGLRAEASAENCLGVVIDLILVLVGAVEVHAVAIIDHREDAVVDIVAAGSVAIVWRGRWSFADGARQGLVCHQVTASTSHPRHIGVETLAEIARKACIGSITVGGAPQMNLGQGFVAMRSLWSGQVHLAAMTLALSAFTIDGGPSTFAAESTGESQRQAETISNSAIPSPAPALLRRQPEPACAFRGPVSDPITAEETRQKLDYEQQCYRASETIVRARLGQLQDYLQKMTQSLPNPALLQRQPEPDCAFRGSVSNPITAEETRQKLDYEQQCYRASETIVRARLDQLQDSVQKMTKSRKATATSREINSPTPVRQLLKFLAHELAEFDSTTREWAR
jgi:hypothetical protein